MVGGSRQAPWPPWCDPLVWTCQTLECANICWGLHKTGLQLHLWYLHPKTQISQAEMHSARPKGLRGLTSRNMNALPSSALGAKAMNFAISSFEGNIVVRMQYILSRAERGRGADQSGGPFCLFTSHFGTLVVQLNPAIAAAGRCSQPQ
jgi:hypothetical protein